MSEKNLTSDIDRLYDAVNSIHKSLQCTICLELMTEPVKTRCGHSFCKLCAAKILQKKPSSCALCKKKLDRRNISKDNHLQLCIEKFTALVAAIKTDSSIDILSYSKRSRDTKESCFAAGVSHSSSNRKVSSKAQSTHQNSDRQIEESFKKQETAINRDNHQHNLDINEKSISTIPNAFSEASFADDINSDKPEVKVRTWLHKLPDELDTNIPYLSENDIVSMKGKATPINQSEDDSKSDATSKSFKMSKSRKTSKRQSLEYIDENIENRKTSRTKKGPSQPKKTRASQSDEVKTIDSSTTDKLKYAQIHGKVREKSQKKNATKPDIEETNNQENSTLTTATIEERDQLSLNAANTSSANWTGVLEFGKEIRAKKKRIKKLNVSTEKNKKPQIIENIKLSPKSKYDLTKVASSKTDRNQANVSNLLEESSDGEEDTIDKSSNLSKNAAKTLKASSETNVRNKDVSFTKDKDTSSTTNLPMETIVLEEGRRIHIMHLNNDQVNQIIGIKNSKSNSQHVENQYRKENVESKVYPDLSLSPQKRLTTLTPKKLNESVKECKRVTPNAAQASIRNSRNSSDLIIEDEIVIQGSSSVKRTSEVVSSPLSGRLSLKRKLEVCNNPNTKSPPSSQLPLADRLLIDRCENYTGDCRNVNSKNETQSARMVAVRRHLNLDTGNIVTGSTAPKSIKNQGHGHVKFIQLGTLIRTNNVRYSYLGATKCEWTLPAQVEITTIYNMQQSISRQEIEEHVAHETLRDLVAPSNPSNGSKSLSNITAVENLHFADNLSANPTAVSEDARFLSATTTRKVSATSTRMDIDRDSSRKRMAAAERPSMKAEMIKRSTGLAGDAEKSSRSLHKTLRAHSDSSAIPKTSHAHSSSTNSVKLLSPDEDSQLKFLAIDSPTSKSEDSKASSIWHQTVKESNFAASSRTARKSSSESSNKKRRRTRYADDEELFDDSDDSSTNTLCNVPTKHNKCSRFHDEKSDLDANKKRRLSSSSDQNVEVNSISEEQDEPKKIIEKKTSDLDIDLDNTELKLLANVAENWESHKTPEIKEDSQNRKSMRCSTVEKPASHQSSCSTNALESEKHKKTRSSEKSFTTKESDMFESNSIFHSDNLDLMLEEMMGSNSRKTQIRNSSNDDIINRVLQIDQPRDNPDACQSPSSIASNGRTSQSKKNSGDYLLQDNFDETIANVDLPQSEDIISSSDQPVRNHTRTLAEQNTPNCLTMTDGPRGATQETSISDVLSTSDIFEHSSRNVRKLSTRNAAENFDKKNTISCSHRKCDSVDDRGDKRNTTAKHFVDKIDKDFHGEITEKHNVSREKEKSFNHAENLQIDKEHDVSANSMDQLDDDTLMNATQDQAHLQILEHDLFSSPSPRKKTPKMTSQNDREEQRTPKKRKLNDGDKGATTGEHYEEDDIVENTPERKKKSNESNIKTVESRKSTSYPSPITITSSVFKMAPLDESTPKVKRPAVSKQSKKDEAILSGNILLPKQMDDKTSENIRQLPDRQKLCFVCTTLSKVQVSFVMELAAKHNANYVNQFDRNVTHVIVNTNGEQNLAKSTLKYLQGIAHRKWIVSYRWVEDCLKEEKLLDEVPYEATTYNDDIIGIKGPRNSRLREKDLFEGFTFLCVKPYHDVSHSQYQDLLLATGATVVDSLEELSQKKGMKGVVIQDNTHDTETIEHWYHTAKAAPITVEWIVECIGQYKLLKLACIYLSLEDFQTIGYPRELLEEYEEYSDDEN